MLSAEGKMEYFYDALEASNGFSDEIKKAVAMTSSIVNSVNCSASPDCKNLNREQCGSKAGSCGPCLESFIGENGYANSYCVVANSRRKLLDISPTESYSCEIADDCPLRNWHVYVDNKCVVRAKNCVDDCSGFGSCDFVSVYDANVSYTECSVMNSNCQARCSCNPGRMGSYCEYSFDDYNKTLATRHRLVEAIRDVSLLEDTAQDTIVSCIEGIASICADLTGLADNTKILMAE